MRKRCSAPNPAIVAAFVVLLVAGGRPVSGGRICKAVIDCPLNWKDQTVHVPDSVVMVSEIFEHCSPDSFREAPVVGTEDTISLFFIIDHSGSMSYMDSTATRYDVVEKLIDTLAARSPESEVGITVFSNQLLHDYRDDSYFVQLDPSSEWHDSYIPLTRLDTTVGSMSAVEKLKWSIALSPTPNDTDIGGNRRLLNANYGVTGRHSGHDIAGNPVTGYNTTTDISLAFEAARKAFETARYPADRRYVIFLSDGVHQYVDVERRPNQLDYQGGEGVPTTFTAFFINETQPIPDQINTMTDNIAANGYSSTNTQSEVWKVSGREGELIDRLLNKFPGMGQKLFPSEPRALTMNGVSAVSFDSTLAYFDEPFVLESDTTTFDVSFQYYYLDPLNIDTTREFSFDVVRSRDRAAIEEDSYYIRLECWDQGILELRYANEVVTEIEGDWTPLQARFYPPSEFPIDEVTLRVGNATGSDELVLTTENHGSYFGARFNRAIGSPSIDDTLQNGLNDSVIVTYRNPDIPYDVVRLAVRVLPLRDLEVTGAYYLDQSGGMADGYADVIRVEFGDTLYADEIDAVAPFIQVQSDRDLEVTSVIPSSRGFDILLKHGADEEPFTGLYPGERLYIDQVPDLPRGGAFPSTDIALADSMGPVIVGADYYDLADIDSRDTLVVRFSESVKRIGSATPFLFPRGSSSTQYSPRLSAVDNDGSEARFAVVPVDGRTEPAPGDSIWIDSTAGVSDTLPVAQQSNNVRRVLNYHLLYMVKAARYIDADDDGLIDTVRVTMDRPPDRAMLDKLTSTVELPAYRNFTYTKDDFSLTDEGYEIAVTQPADTEPFTAVDNRDSLTTARTQSSTGGLILRSRVPITDDMAPVIVGARFRPRFVTDSSSIPPDTIVVTYSEPVDAPAEPTPLVLFDGRTGEPYTMELRGTSSGSGTEHTYLVTGIEGTEFPASGDSLRMEHTAGVKDKQGNVQDNENNRMAPLVVGAFKYRFSVKSAPNPFDPLTATTPSIAGIGSRRGTALLVRPLGPIPGDIRLEGTVSLYDCMGNLIVDRMKGTTADGNEYVAFVWDGTNLNGRYVGTGSYLAVVVIEDNKDHKETRKLKIGVRR